MSKTAEILKEKIEREAERVYDKRDLVDHQYPSFQHINTIHTQRCRRAFQHGANFALEMDRWIHEEPTEKGKHYLCAIRGRTLPDTCYFSPDGYWYHETISHPVIIAYQPLPPLPQ